MTSAQDSTDSKPITVVIADDQGLVRAGFRVILANEPGIRVVGEASDGREAVELVRRLAPAIVLMDIRMPNMDGLAAAASILRHSDSRVLILTTFDADEYVYQALKLGASGFLLKDAPLDQLVSAVRCIAAGDALIDPAITRRLIRRFAQAARPSTLIPAQLKELTMRELDVLRLLARGLANAEIAGELVVEESTVKTHVSRILMKLALRDRVQAVVLAYESGFIVPDDRASSLGWVNAIRIGQDQAARVFRGRNRSRYRHSAGRGRPGRALDRLGHSGAGLLRVDLARHLAAGRGIDRAARQARGPGLRPG